MDLVKVECELRSPCIEAEIDQLALPKLDEIASLVGCVLCGGYLINATTINRCLHSFCRACIVAHLKVRSVCPTCNGALNPVHPHSNLRRDRVLQRLVYKMIPGLYHYEIKKRVEFAEKLLETGQCMSMRRRAELDSRTVLYCDEDVFSVALHYGLDQSLMRTSTLNEMIVKYSEGSNECLTTYLECPSRLTVRIFKKFVRRKFEVSECFLVELFSSTGERWSDRMTLKDVAYSSSSGKVGMLQLFFTVINKRFCSRSIAETSSCLPEKRRRLSCTQRMCSSRSPSYEKAWRSVNDTWSRDVIGGPIGCERTVSSDDGSRPIERAAHCNLESYTENSIGQSGTFIHQNLEHSVIKIVGSQIDNPRDCEMFSDKDQLNSDFGHLSCRPFLLISPHVSSVSNPGNMVLQCGGLPSLQIVGHCTSASGTDGVCGPVLLNEANQLFCPSVYRVSQDNQRFVTLTTDPRSMHCGGVEFMDQLATFELVPRGPDLPPHHWRLHREVLEAQRYQSFTSGLPLLSLATLSPSNSDAYVSVLNSLTSVEINSKPDHLVSITQFCSENFSPNGEPDSSSLNVNDL